ncbi:hypothetical protein [Flavobacterium aestivum]|uniref:hypothetical protein n=1 Tax=Flavobacterium aestivum TaxID=3003257 RepID=UPI0024825D56|nr:hypothetical protein [Flavobacterium aestivum]
MKKKINIALILVVLTVWGFVASKALSQYFFLDKKTTNNQQFDSRQSINKINKDTFALGNITRDPFLNKESRTYAVATPSKNAYFKKTTIKKEVKPIVVKQKEIINWPQITYHGYINSKDRNGELLILVNVDKKLHKLKLNQQSDGITLKKVYKDSIELDFNREKKIFRIQ